MIRQLIKYLKKLTNEYNVRAVGSYVISTAGEKMCKMIGLYEINTWRNVTVQAFHAFPLELKVIGKTAYNPKMSSEHVRSLLAD
ncbi:hypothetical protein D3C71_1858410 [compost metagenome]